MSFYLDADDTTVFEEFQEAQDPFNRGYFSELFSGGPAGEKEQARLDESQRALFDYTTSEYDLWVDYNFNDAGNILSDYDTQGDVTAALRGGRTLAAFEEEHNILLQAATQASRSLEAGERRFHRDIAVSAGRSLEDIESGTLGTAIESNREQAFKEAQDIINLGQKQADIARRRIQAGEENLARAQAAQFGALAGTIVGGVVGGAVAGPPGASIGAGLGGSAGQVIGGSV